MDKTIEHIKEILNQFHCSSSQSKAMVTSPRASSDVSFAFDWEREKEDYKVLNLESHSQ